MYDFFTFVLFSLSWYVSGFEKKQKQSQFKLQHIYLHVTCNIGLSETHCDNDLCDI